MKNSILTKVDYADNLISSHLHYHNGYEIIFIHEGEIEIKIDKKLYNAKNGDMIIISNLDEHEIKILSPVYKRYYIIMDQQATDNHIANPDLLSMFKNHTSRFNHVFTTDDKNLTAELKELFERILYESTKNYPFAYAVINSLIAILLVKLYNLNENKIFTNNSRFKLVSEIQRYLDTHYMEKLNINELSNKFFISAYYITHMFKKYTNYSPKQYLLLTRLSHAKALLATTDISLADICVKCGFSDINNFIRYFKREYNITPGAFRQVNKPQ